MKTTRTVTKPRGELRPDSLYTTEGVMKACGLGSNALDAARASGIVKAYQCGNRLYYLGSELIKWIVSQG